MPWIIPATIIGSSLLSADSASNAADTAARASGQASDASIAEQRRQFDIAQANQQPFLAAGTGAVNQLGAGLQPGGRFSAAPQFNFDYNQNTDPGYGFRFDQGMRGVNASMAARGRGLSGANIKGAIDYGQGMGSQEYNNAFNRYVTGFNANTNAQNTDFNRLSGVAGTGQTAAGNLATLGSNTAGNIGNALMGSAANTGNAALASAGLRSSAYGGAANMLGRYYGGYGGGSNPYANAARANQQYGAGNVYGFGGGGAAPVYDPTVDY
jgi:hypothetical protein